VIGPRPPSLQTRNILLAAACGGKRALGGPGFSHP
jgi:hypothetical protein